ncbi:DUF4132 domain-containing protein [Actinomadura sp. CNU-125]|uniref:DUF4132 domain-containing protein n=1 Tax=Actinomadura sp. CNU-125 TaxID=1904961 RepID=UPI0029162CD7|nr:DUF4132 domain-containing protein [Actinomadura sp. CNU-125]
MADWLVRLKTAGKTARAWFARHGLAAAPALIPTRWARRPGAARREAPAPDRRTGRRRAGRRGGARPRRRGRRRDRGHARRGPPRRPPQEDPVRRMGRDPGASAAPPARPDPRPPGRRRRARPDHVRAVDPGRGVSRRPHGRRTVRPGVPRRVRLGAVPLVGGVRRVLEGELGVHPARADRRRRDRPPPHPRDPGVAGAGRPREGRDGTGRPRRHRHRHRPRAPELDLPAREVQGPQDPRAAEDRRGGRRPRTDPRRVGRPPGPRPRPGRVRHSHPRLRPPRLRHRLRRAVEATITDGTTGKHLKSLPKPGTKDDPELAPAAHRQFAQLKKDARAAAAEQIGRLERAMVTGRRWTPAEFGELLAAHPLLKHLVRRLVWQAEDADGRATTFRVAEDGTFTDAADDTVTLPTSTTAHIRIPHPVHLADVLPAWSELFADYEILQPFPQLARPVRTFTDDERTSRVLARLDGVKVAAGALLGLVKRGWERGQPLDAGVEAWISRRVAPGGFVVIDLDPGIVVGSPEVLGDQTLAVRLTERPDAHYLSRDDTTALRFGDIDPVTASEILTDLDHLAG